MSQHLRISFGNKFEYFSILVFSFFLQVLQCICSVMEQQVHRKYVLLINENNIFLFIYLFYFGCTGYFLLCTGFLQLQRVGAPLQLRCTGINPSCCGSVSCCGAWAPGHAGLRSCSSWAPECRLSRQWGTGVVALQHCEIVPSQEWNQCPLRCKVGSQPPEHERSPRKILSKFITLTSM